MHKGGRMLSKPKVATLVAEFLGTFTLASAVLAVVTRESFVFFPALVAGLVLLVMVLVIGPISGAHINPAVTVGLWTQRKIETVKALTYVVAQLLGGYAAIQLAQWYQDTTFAGIAGTSVDARTMVAEAIGAAVFGFGIIVAVQRGYDGARQAVAIGFSLTLGILVASLGSNAIINPAVAVGLNSVSVSYLLAPVVGMIAGMTLYSSLFVQPAKKKR